MLKKRHPALIVLKHLLIGGRYEQDGYTWCLDEDHNICSISTNQKGEEVLLKCDFSLGAFIRLCMKLSEEEVFTIAANTALTEV